ncbi:cobalt transporter CbiM [Thermodesulfobacterium hveragerdense]|uniref:cobalt transporter CbiM n=1 Tax=Thermodesulfobacterium hveragerdense TaxID=53424 RepID=UPI0004092D18|nr:cobalt transporter CbiM [Thermodesulfobacterium hveragerdense]
MHISEGVLSPPVLITGWGLTLIGLTISLKKLSTRKIPEVAVLSSAFFIASLIHVPIGPSAAHLVLNGMVGILLGWNSFVAIFLGLLLQALFFQFGGFTTLGINTFNMAFPGVVSYYLFKRFIGRKNHKLSFISGFLAGFLSMLGAGFFTALSLYLTERNFLILCETLIIAHIPIAVVEGLVTGFIVVYLLKIKPEVFKDEV